MTCIPPSPSEYLGQYLYAPQQYMLSMNYAAPPFDIAEYPMSDNILLHTAKHSPRSYQIIPGSNYHSGQYMTHISSMSSMNTHFEYPPSDPTPFQHTTYNSVGYFKFSVNGYYCLLLDGQHQQSLVSDPLGYSCCDGSFDQFNAIAQDSIVLIPPSSSSSELGHTLLEVCASDAQQVGHTLFQKHVL